MNPSLKKQLFKTFAQMISDLESRSEVEKFLIDFFDEKELDVYVKRISIAYWLKKGRDEENIIRNLLASSKDLAMAKRSLKKAGIKLALKKMEADEWANIWAKKIKKVVK